MTVAVVQAMPLVVNDAGCSGASGPVRRVDEVARGSRSASVAAGDLLAAEGVDVVAVCTVAKWTSS